MSGEAENPDSFSSEQLALERTWLAHERTLMAWVRTAASMISLGFTIYKFFQFEEGAKARPGGVVTPREFAMIMIGIGLISLFLSVVDHRRQVRVLASHLVRKERSLAELVAAMVSVFGILALVAATLRG